MRYTALALLFLVGCSGAPTQVSERDYQMACIQGCKRARNLCRNVKHTVYRTLDPQEDRCHKQYLVCYVDHCHITQMLEITEPL